MGYYTDFTLEIDTPELTDDIAEVLETMHLDPEMLMGCSINSKWYEYYNDMMFLSTKFPETTFILSGIGEEFPDMWKARYINGHVDEVRAEVSYPDFPPR